LLRWTQGFALALVTRSVAAEPAPPPPPPPPAASADPPVSTATDGARYSDAHSDRVLLFPTGETHPSGTFFISSYDIVGLGLGYALTDRFELELTAVLPGLVDAAAKLNVLRSDWWRLATYGALDVPIYAFGPPVYRAGVTGQVCLSKLCWSSISLSAIGAAGNTDLFPRHYGAAGSAGAILALSRTVKFLFEPVVSWVPGDATATEALWSAGLRIGHERWALDLGFTYLGQGSGDSWPILPLIFFTWRTRGDGD
jgi:hypothetical protein